MKIGVVIPALDEEGSVGQVVRRTLAQAGSRYQLRVVVADNNSSDRTGEIARRAGAEVVKVVRPGYGAACLGAIDALGQWPSVMVFLDADGSSRPEEIGRLIQPIEQQNAELVLGVRPKHSPMTVPQRWGTWLAVQLLNLRWGSRFTDMGPFRAVTRSAFERLGMRDLTWGWTLEMQILAVKNRLRIQEVPVSWEKRIAGVSKISGTISGVLRAGVKILWVLGKHALRKR